MFIDGSGEFMKNVSYKFKTDRDTTLHANIKKKPIADDLTKMSRMERALWWEHNLLNVS